MSRPSRLEQFDYTGLHQYFLTSCTYLRQPWFEKAEHVDLVLSRILRTSMEQDIAVDVYCAMPDHLHALVRGTTPVADLRQFMRLVKQRSGVVFHRLTGHRLWQEGYYDHIVRREESRRRIVGYIVENPVRAGLVEAPEMYPFWGSFTQSRQEILDFVVGRDSQSPGVSP